jgi:hypothetical protein
MNTLFGIISCENSFFKKNKEYFFEKCDNLKNLRLKSISFAGHML